MKKIQYALTFLFFITSLTSFAQDVAAKKIKITGKVIEKISKQPLEYTTVTFSNPASAKIVAGGITDSKGEFSVEVIAGTYSIKIEYISFKPLLIEQKNLKTSSNLGTISLEEDATQLNEVVLRSEKTTVEIKLDKKVYNVGKDLIVKGGTVSDVLDNIPSVAVDAEGTISLRGNENVRILIDGKPSNASNISEALKQIPADAIEKVEVITNPSARYDSEGGGGIINIIIKKGKNIGTNGTIIASSGYPENYGLSGTINYKTKQFNLFTTTGYNYRKNPGNFFINSEYLNPDGSTKKYINEKRKNERLGKGYNSSIGVDWFLDKTTTWTNTVNIRKFNSNNPEDVNYDYFDENNQYTSSLNRYNNQISTNNSVEFNSNFSKNFKREGHKLTFNGTFTKIRDNESSIISSNIIENTSNLLKDNENMLQLDYVLPFANKSQFEFGYKGNFRDNLTDFKVGKYDNSGNYIPNLFFTNTLEYKENINALYSQFGTKINSFSFLFGLRWEDSKIQINQLATNDFNTRKYSNLFPSAFLTYEFNSNSSVSFSYSKRISRPRGRQINPFSNYSSNINIFQGNPKLNPAYTDALDFGYLIRFDKLTFNTSAYINKTSDSFQFIRKESGNFVNGTPEILSTFINLETENRLGFEFTINYSPYKWIKLNSNFNFFQVETLGDYVYSNSQNSIITKNFNNKTTSWFARLSSKISLPKNIDWQTNLNYNGPQNNAQGKSYGIFVVSLAFSKDILKEKATIAIGVQDLLNTRKRIFDTYIPGTLFSHAEMQRAVRQFTISFTYRFNKQKSDKEKQPKRDSDFGDDYQG
jgi:outer membrane receptor protein involved in Fe transport